MSAVILEEGGLVRVQGQGRRVFRVKTIHLVAGTFDAIDDNGATRTFLTTAALPAKAGDVGPKRSGQAPPAGRKAGRR